MVARIGEALAQMPERCRTVLIRRRFDNQSPTEIARELGISLSTLEKRLARAVVLLGRALDPAMPSSPATSDLDETDSLADAVTG
jgi:RNA polymerase sigma-70 factor (ECF subfamily)